MMRLACTWLLATAVLHAAVSTDRGRPQSPSPAAPGGTASISGRVSRAHDGGPLRLAAVIAESLDGEIRRSATTDDLGHFVVTGLAPGRYAITARAAGYVEGVWRKDGASPGRGYLALAANDQRDGVHISLARGGVITGRVVDSDGIPVEGVPVHALVSEFRNGRELLRQTAARPRVTDDRGYFRLFGLDPAEYFVAAIPGAFGDQPGGSLPGHALTYFPGVSSVADAQPITVSADRESAISDLVVRPVPTAVITGAVLDANGAPRGGVELVLLPASGPISSVLPRATSDGVGRFSFSDIPEGRYLLQNLPPPTAPSEFGVAPLNVSGDATAAVLRLQAAALRHGSVVFEDGAPDFSPRRLMIVLQAATRTHSPLARGARAKVLNDWSLELTNIWGPQFLRLVDPPAGWMVRHVYAGAEDFVDRPIDFSRDGSHAVRVVMTRRAATVSGTVRDGDRTAAAGARVLIYSADATRWFQDDRAIQWTRTDGNGQYHSRGMPSGEYLVAAVNDLAVREWPPRPALLESLRLQATAVSVTEGRQHSQDLSLVAAPR